MNPFTKIANYREERKKWKIAGFPVRTDERIIEIFNICQSCPQYKKIDEHQGRCSICGCYLKDKDEGFNKIAWATTSCPADPALWIEEVKVEEVPQEINQEEPPPSPQPVRGGCGCGR